MSDLSFPLLTLTVAAPLAGAGALALTRSEGQARSVAVGASAVALLLSMEAVRQVASAGGDLLSDPWTGSLLAVNALSAVPMALFAALALATLVMAPRRDSSRRMLLSTLALLCCALISYAAASLWVFAAGWTLSAAVYVSVERPRKLWSMSNIALAGSVVALGFAAVIAPLAQPWAFGLLLAATVLRIGVFPAHSAIIGMIDRGPLMLSALFVNAQLGAFLLARFGVPMFPEIADRMLPPFGALALFTAIYAAVLGFAERNPRRILGTLIVSESANILAGLASSTAEGITGALIHWTVLAVASTILIGVYRSVEVRVDEDFAGDSFHGLASPMPRLAVFFFVAGLALVGIPFLPGFSAGDLLLHGAMDAYPWLGVALPLATALNAFNIFRLFARLFLGKPTTVPNSIPDALPRERWVLSACLAFLLWGGLAPSQWVAFRAAAAETLVNTVNPR